ncbi:S-layer homology domain-containing protein [Bacillus thuringiensis]|uniref:S-layer homology domain-containing protein n=1 Tax=Bacillus thuringiensis TaxID=1428 RepID=UPI002DBA45FF|nr:S-layer homology domain-containing protein [Bacillus thuringiensis]MEC2839836.1 S-layer homology domain-containing protein [Bacillus thuringiensis]MEC3495706.1 S-layer homology domain-containing protein [Bacillus thuringiensis]MED2824608.1 S-layer homology domain-containing protein [Bacillus thuringiensis]MED3609939.1 S-layer homology domain-containing protein [Bacillus thuringiensis]
MKKKLLTTATALTIMGTAVLGTGASVNAADNTDSLKYNDVPANHWSTKAIYDLTNRKVVQGYGNNVFGFGDNVTRGQVARMIYTYVKPADADASFKSPFTDIKGHLFEKEILAVAKAGLVKGFGDGKYGPDDILTREQMAQVLTNAFKFKGTKTTKFADVDKNSWAYGAISALEENGVTIGTGGNMYSPQMHVTREAYSQFLYNSINVVEKKKPETKPEEKLPQGLDSGLATPETKFNETAFNNLQVSQDSVSSPAQNIVKSVNQKYGTNLKYNNIGAEVTLKDEGMYLPSSTFNAQFLVESIDKDNYKILFLSNNNATVELAKEWVKLLTPALNVDKEIDTMVNSPKISNYEKGDHKVRIGLTMVDKMLYVQVKSN